MQPHLHLALYTFSLAAGLLALFLLRNQPFVLRTGAASAAVVFTGGLIAALSLDVVGFGLMLAFPFIMWAVTAMSPREELASGGNQGALRVEARDVTALGTGARIDDRVD